MRGEVQQLDDFNEDDSDLQSQNTSVDDDSENLQRAVKNTDLADEETTARSLFEDPEVREKVLRITNSEVPLKEPPIPTCPIIEPSTKISKSLYQIQKYINAFEYNHTGQTFFCMKRDRGMKHVTTIAKEIMRDAFPIQCVEGVFLGTYLTAQIKSVTRIPVSFKSEVDGKVYRHIILAVEHKNKWGALGISRRKTLAYKEMKYDSLGDLMKEYKESYEGSWHELLKIYVGLPFSRDSFSSTKLQWRVLKVLLEDRSWEKNSALLNKFSKDCGAFLEYFCYTGELPPAFVASYYDTDHETRKSSLKLGKKGGKLRKTTKN